MRTHQLEESNRLHLWLPDSLRSELEAVARVEDRTMSAVARIALREYIDRRTTQTDAA